MTTPRKDIAKRPVSISADARRKWLEAIALGASKSRAAELAGVARQRFAERLATDPVFKAQFEEAAEQAADAAEDELAERSREGFEEVVLDGNGKVIRRTLRKHPQDLHMRLKALRPEKYRESTQVAVGFQGYDVQPMRHERGLTLGDIATWAVEHKIPLGRGLSELTEAADRGELSAEGKALADVAAGLKDIGVLDADFVPAHLPRALEPGSTDNGSGGEQ